MIRLRVFGIVSSYHEFSLPIIDLYVFPISLIWHIVDVSSKKSFKHYLTLTFDQLGMIHLRYLQALWVLPHPFLLLICLYLPLNASPSISDSLIQTKTQLTEPQPATIQHSPQHSLTICWPFLRPLCIQPCKVQKTCTLHLSFIFSKLVFVIVNLLQKHRIQQNSGEHNIFTYSCGMCAVKLNCAQKSRK